VVPRDKNVTSNGVGIGGGIGSAPDGYDGHVTFYVEVPDVEAAMKDLEAKGVEFVGSGDTGVCRMAVCLDPDGNALILHRRYKPYE